MEPRPQRDASRFGAPCVQPPGLPPFVPEAHSSTWDPNVREPNPDWFS
jgi:hypothetical protein